MDRNPPRRRYELFILTGMLFLGGLVWLFVTVGNPFSSSNVAPVSRQSIPPPNVLELPPNAPLPSVTHPFFSKITPVPTPKPSPGDQKTRPVRKSRKSRVKIPTKWEIIKAYQQVIELDMKYIQIAVTSDRYGYRNQAISYYRKYLSVAPTGPYANQVRARLSQLESSP